MVYLVDDDSDDLEFAQAGLSEHGYRGPVVTAGNGKELMDQLSDSGRAPSPSVIVLDLNMPILDGFETLQRIRLHPVYGSIPVIVLTASSKKADEMRSYELGCNFFLTKPSRMSDYNILTGIVIKLAVHQLPGA